MDGVVVILQLLALSHNFNVYNIDHRADLYRFAMAVVMLLDATVRYLVLGNYAYWKQTWSKTNTLLTFMLANCMFSIQANPHDLQLTAHVVARSVPVSS